MITPLDVIKGLTDIEMNKSQNVTAKRVLEIMKIQPENEETPMNNMFSIDESKPVLDALRLMIRTHANKFIATKDGKFKGLFTTRQYCRKMGLKRKNPENVKVGDVVETAAVFVKPEDTISKCFKLFMENKLVRNLIVSNSKNAEDILGIISSRDCLRCLYTE
ncbi:hypothetical protein MHBO_001741 [Bonamia ostreae]|uniref:CBS domain-containing protein n=1 Tax=Bonamia ostreae TaxID=126728 RepID=A0ABV2AK04_9EUKA